VDLPVANCILTPEADEGPYWVDERTGVSADGDEDPGIAALDEKRRFAWNAAVCVTHEDNEGLWSIGGGRTFVWAVS
jgi:hypothetical protein